MNSLHMSEQLQLDRPDLELVSAIATNGTVSRAAQKLHLSQSALSHHLRRLEERVGQPLFERLPRKMIPTPIGREFVRQADRILGEFAQSEQLISSFSESPRRLIRLGTECYTSYHWLPRVIRCFEKCSVPVEFSISLEATGRIKEALLAREIDAGIAFSIVNHPKLIARPLFFDEFRVVVSNEHPFAARSALSARDFADQKLLVYQAPFTESPLYRYFAAAGAWPKSIVEVPLTDVILDMVEANLGISVLAGWMTEKTRRTVKLLRLAPPGMVRQWSLVTDHRQAKSKEIDELCAVLRNERVMRKAGWRS
jgi:LysR family transcriptional regulator for metE and metH